MVSRSLSAAGRRVDVSRGIIHLDSRTAGPVAITVGIYLMTILYEENEMCGKGRINIRRED